jgi:hypothetical protein
MWDTEAVKRCQFVVFVVNLKVLLFSGVCCLVGRSKNLLNVLDRDISRKITTWKTVKRMGFQGNLCVPEKLGK